MKSLSLKTLYASQVALNATLAIAAFCVFAIDLAVPHGYTIWMLYLPICVGVAWSERPREAIVACALATALIMIAMVFTFERAPSLSTITSRSLGILTIWLSVSLVLLRHHGDLARRSCWWACLGLRRSLGLGALALLAASLRHPGHLWLPCCQRASRPICRIGTLHPTRQSDHFATA